MADWQEQKSRKKQRAVRRSEGAGFGGTLKASAPAPPMSITRVEKPKASATRPGNAQPPTAQEPARVVLPNAKPPTQPPTAPPVPPAPPVVVRPPFCRQPPPERRVEQARPDPRAYDRPDFSEYLVHFTKDGRPVAEEFEQRHGREMREIPPRAIDRLINILKGRSINRSPLPHIGRNEGAVCFTECPWTSLLPHSQNYSPYGVGFSRMTLYRKGANPVFYVRDELYNETQWPPSLHLFTTKYQPGTRAGIDYIHEREWRYADRDFRFSLKDIAFIVVDTIEDIHYIEREIPEVVEAIGKDKFLLMSNYRLVQRLWPSVHIAAGRRDF